MNRLILTSLIAGFTILGIGLCFFFAYLLSLLSLVTASIIMGAMLFVGIVVVAYKIAGRSRVLCM